MRYFSMMEVNIGAESNTKTELRLLPSGPAEYTVLTPGLLSCTLEVTLWMEWTNGRLDVSKSSHLQHVFTKRHCISHILCIQMGEGPVVGSSRFFSYRRNQPEFLISSLSVSSGTQHPGTWVFTDVSLEGRSQ